jgi:hypothetical protein
MDLNKYQNEIAPRTLNKELDSNTQLIGLSMGMTGEIGELYHLVYSKKATKESVMDEGGDICWYIANVCNTLNLHWTMFFPGKLGGFFPTDVLLADIVVSNAQFTDNLKKVVAQGHEMHLPKVCNPLFDLVSSLCELFAYYDLTPEEVCAYNNEKLLKRYPNGFEASRSVNREV